MVEHLAIVGQRQRERDSRVLVVSMRHVSRPLWQVAQYEFEDLLTQWDDVRLLAPPAVRHPTASSVSRRVINGSLHRLHLPRRSPPWVFPSIQRTRVDTHHDVFVMVAHYAHQLSYLARLPGWRERCRSAVCVLIEAWSPDFPADEDYLQVLRRFDKVYVFNRSFAALLAGRGVTNAAYLPMAVDTAAFAPAPLTPPRSIDVYSIGRRSPWIHRSLLSAVEDRGLTYVYDTVEGWQVERPQEHRALVANAVKRSRLFMAHRINDSPERRERTGGDESLTSRYFEGAAGGAVLLGSPTPNEDYRACFGWPDALMPLPYDAEDAADRVADLLRQRDRLQEAGARNAQESLRRHDWVHRWKVLLQDLGLQPAAQVSEREDRLAELAALVPSPGRPWRPGRQALA